MIEDEAVAELTAVAEELDGCASVVDEEAMADWWIFSSPGARHLCAEW